MTIASGRCAYSEEPPNYFFIVQPLKSPKMPILILSSSYFSGIIWFGSPSLNKWESPKAAFYTTVQRVTYMVFITAMTTAEKLSVSKRTTSSLTLKWEAPAEGGLTGYNVTVEGDGKYQTQSLDNVTTTHTFVGLTPGTQYTVNVIALRNDVQAAPLVGKYYTSTCCNLHLRFPSIYFSTEYWHIMNGNCYISHSVKIYCTICITDMKRCASVYLCKGY